MGADIKSIEPVVNNTFLLVMFSMLKWGIVTNISPKKLGEYDEVIIWGPIWAGALIAPLRNVIKKCVRASKNIHFAVTCETAEKDKDRNYGYMNALSEARKIGGTFAKTTDAFSLAILKEDDAIWSPKQEEKTIITETSFNHIFSSKFDDYIGNFRVEDSVKGKLYAV